MPVLAEPGLVTLSMISLTSLHYDQSEASIRVTGSLSTNQRPVTSLHSSALPRALSFAD